METSEHLEERRPATRNTIQRTLVLEAVQSLHHHPTSADVYEVVRVKHPHISRATVYRNLALLAERGDILHVEVAGGADCYDYINHPHYHAHCRCCGGVFDVDMPYNDNLIDEVHDTQGFIFEGHQIMFDGVCANCSAK